ncbi:hypothetical protein, partial [Streptomyces sp. NPDC056227]
MTKLERGSSNSSASLVPTNGFQSVFRQSSKSIKTKLEKAFFDWGLLIFLTGFLLGRALILSHILPFVLPFFASVY